MRALPKTLVEKSDILATLVYEKLKTIDRPQVIKAIAEAREHGDVYVLVVLGYWSSSTLGYQLIFCRDTAATAQTLRSQLETSHCIQGSNTLQGAFATM